MNKCLRKLNALDWSNHKYAEPIINVIKICGIGIWTIFDAVFRYLPFFLTLLRYWVPPNVPLMHLGLYLEPERHHRHLYLDSADSINGQEAVLMLQAVQGPVTGSHSHRATSTSTAATPCAGSKVQQTSFFREVVLLNDPQDVSVVRGAQKANLHRSGNVLSAFMFNKSWTALEVCENLERAFPNLNNVEEKPKVWYCRVHCPWFFFFCGSKANS